MFTVIADNNEARGLLELGLVEQVEEVPQDGVDPLHLLVDLIRVRAVDVAHVVDGVVVDHDQPEAVLEVLDGGLQVLLEDGVVHAEVVVQDDALLRDRLAGAERDVASAPQVQGGLYAFPRDD